MKSKRRHELKSNDLAHALEQLSHSFKDWAGYVIGAVAVVVVGTLIVTYMKTARETAMDEAYAELTKLGQTAQAGVSKSNEELHRTLTKMGDLGNSSTDPAFKLEALLLKADTAMAIALNSESGVDPMFLNEARAAFEEIVTKHKDLPIHYGRALFGLFQIEANEFSVDGDMSHRDKAEGYLEQLRDEQRLAGVPFQTMAIDKLNELDDIFTKVTFPERPASVTQTVIPQGGSQPSASVTLGTPTAVEAPVEADAAADEAPEVQDVEAGAEETPPSTDDPAEPAEKDE